MFSLVETAYAMAPSGGGGGGDGSAVLAQFVPLILIFLIFWFLVIRPQQKRAKSHRQLVANLKKGDEIYTDSGIRGTITRVGDETVTVEIAPKVNIRLQRGRVADVVKESRQPDKAEAKEEGE